jgi:hypothetical protein
MVMPRRLGGQRVLRPHPGLTQSLGSYAGIQVTQAQDVGDAVAFRVLNGDVSQALGTDGRPS